VPEHKNFKNFYAEKTSRAVLREYFPKILSYCKFLMLERKVMLALLAFVQYSNSKKAGIYYIDSTSLPVCRNQRI
jgi:hypothetical protein